MSISDESKEKAIFHLENAIECLKKGFGEDAEINAEEAKNILSEVTKKVLGKRLTLEERATIASDRGEMGLNHADCVACGKAIGHSEKSEWIHLDGIPCADAPWLCDGTLEASESDFTEAYLNHRKTVIAGGREPRLKQIFGSPPCKPPSGPSNDEEAKEKALNALCYELQTYLGITCGGFADRYFSGDREENIKGIMQAYMEAERKDLEETEHGRIHTEQEGKIGASQRASPKGNIRQNLLFKVWNKNRR